jgi:hypothetical protein
MLTTLLSRPWIRAASGPVLGLRREDIRASQSIVEELAIAPELDAAMFLFAITVRGNAEYEASPGGAAEPAGDTGKGARGRLVVSVGVRRDQRGQQASRPRMEKPQTRDAAVARLCRDRGDSVVHAAWALAFVVHDDRNVVAEVAPGARQQHVLNRLATDVLGILFARQHPI